MEEIRLKAYAKVNLALDVLCKLDNGYHSLDGVMHTIDLWDEVTVKKHSEIIVRSDIPLPEDNTAYRAAKLYFEAVDITGGAEIIIKKNIPSQAGLGGASADAAAVLTALCKLYTALDSHLLLDIGKRVGADVPFCLTGGCARARSIGEFLEKLNTQELWLLLVKGEVGISTKMLFDICDSHIVTADNRTEQLVKACNGGDYSGICRNMHNMLERAAITFLPQIAETKAQLMDCGASTAVMTGSGSCLYGVFRSQEEARLAYTQMQGLDYDFLAVSRTI